MTDLHCTMNAYQATNLPGADSDVGAAHASERPQPDAEGEGSPSEKGQQKGSEAEDTEEDEEADAEEGGEVKIILRIKSSSHTEGLKLRIGVDQPLQRLFKGYQDQGNKAGWLPQGAKVTFKFDGDAMNGNDTPKAMDMEDGDVIDACW